jgi:hypothetical protein
MVRVPTPQRTLLPGLGVASAVLAAVILAFASTGAFVAFDLLSDDPQAGPSEPIVLAGPPAPAPAMTPLTASRAPAAPRARVAPAARPAAGAIVAPPAQAPAAVAEITEVEPVTLPTPAARRPPAPPPPLKEAPAPSRPRSGPLAPVGDIVVDATTAVASTLRSTTNGVADTIAAISPPLAEVVVAVGERLGDTVDGTGTLLARLLGRPMPS